jgi:V/A-type H+/Na+-transporting ATPase subunit I
MIVPMYRYVFLVHHLTYQEFLKNIRKLGVVHISTKKNEPTPQMQELFRHLTEVNKAVKRLESLEPEVPKAALPLHTGEEVFNRLKEMEKEMEHNHHRLLQLEKEKKQLTPWGNFDWNTIEVLEQNGIQIRFMACPIRKWQEDWEEKYYLQIVGDLDGYRYFVKVERTTDKKGQTSLSEIPDADELILPKRSLNQVALEMQKLKDEAGSLSHELHQIAACCTDILKKYSESIQQQLSEQNALLQTTNELEGAVRMLEGWVPELKKKELDEFLEEQRILHIAEKPTDTDKVPILLKNNKFAKHYEVIGNLYELPNHKELDMVPFFAPFYMMFFGFSLGDAGYGLFILLAATFVKFKKPELKSILTLAQWLGFATILFGILTGTFFGINLLEAEIPWLERAKAFMINTDQLFNLAIILGATQILFGMILKVVNISRIQGFFYALSTIGWLILIIGLGSIYAMKSAEVINAQAAGFAQIAIFSIAGLLILVFNHPRRNVFINFGAGIWDVYNMFTGLLGDILSYIRLFALGVSSAILGLVFNSMAMSMKPDNVIFGPIVMIIILVLGHGITIFMATLGAFVHPIRLTFVEFYKNAGFTGGGKAYTPFAEPASEKTV